MRGYGNPQATFAIECTMDMLAEKAGIDPIEFRRINALEVGDQTATGQVLSASAGLGQCLDALRPHWQRLRAEVGDLQNLIALTGFDTIVQRGLMLSPYALMGVGTLANRYLARLPYGAKTDPVEEFDFEEDVAGAVPLDVVEDPVERRPERRCRTALLVQQKTAEHELRQPTFITAYPTEVSPLSRCRS